MISRERVRHMTRLAEYENREGETYKKVTQYFRRDYVAMELIKSFITGTIAFCLILLMYLLYEMENLAEQINSMDIMGFGIGIIIWYLVFIALYLFATYVIYNIRYSKGRKHLKIFYGRLKKISSLYLDEEKNQNIDDWEV